MVALGKGKSSQKISSIIGEMTWCEEYNSYEYTSGDVGTSSIRIIFQYLNHEISSNPSNGIVE